MPNTLVKPQKTAAELAELIRNSIGNSDLRVAVFHNERLESKSIPEPGTTPPGSRPLSRRRRLF